MIQHELYDGQIKVKPDYLELDIKDDNYLNSLCKTIYFHQRIFTHLIYSDNLSANPKAFGNFERIKLNKDNIILKFIPYSIDVGRSESETSYETREKALDAAIEFLDNNGFKAKTVNLEDICK